jgi:hypothetical protein
MSKIYSVDEANALLPYLAPTLVELREKFEEATVIRRRVARASTTNGGSLDREDWSKTLARVAELVERIGDWELELRDVTTGLVDFPGFVEGEEAWLCWRLGEAEVEHYHPKDTGFSGRRRLP